jgi:drug/metabolite transporter (DMT)-like permease
MGSAVILSILCGLIAAVCWGSADFFAARASKSDSPELTALLVGILGAVSYTVFYPILSSSDIWTTPGVLYAVSAGLFIGSGLLMLYRGLDSGPVSLVSPIGSAYPLITALIVVTFLGASLTSLQVLGILLIVLGIVAASGLFEAKKSERKLSKGVSFALITFLLWGVGFAFLGESVSRIGWQKTTLVDIWTEAIAIGWIVIIYGKSRYTKRDLKRIGNKFIVIIALIQLFGLIVFDFGLSKSSSSAVITAVSATYPALTIFLAVKHFKEKLSFIPFAGAIVTILGVIILST